MALQNEHKMKEPTDEEKILEQEVKIIQLVTYNNDECEYIEDCEGKTMRVFFLDGVSQEPIFHSSLHDDAKAFIAEPDDVWIVSWPRSGSHWVWEMTQRLLHGIDTFIGPMQKDLHVFALNTYGLKDLPQPRVISSHLRHEFTPSDLFKKECKVILLLRDPRDAIVSWYKFIQRHDNYKYNGSWNGFLSLYYKDQVPRGTWEKHTKDWLLESRNNKNILLLKYEDLREDPLKYIKEIATFLRPSNTYSDTELMRLKEMTDLKAMQQKNSAYNGFFKEGGLGLTYDKGKIGTWKDWFTVAQLEEYTKHYHQHMDGMEDFNLGYIDKLHK